MSQISKEFNSGEPIIGQLFSHIAPEVFTKAAFITQSDVGFRKMTSKVHFICLFYAVLTKNSSIRELCKNITLVGKKLMAYGLDYLPCRSTFSDANAKRNSNYFGTFYSLLYQQHKNFLQDTQFSLPIGGEIDASKVEVFDSTTITLFKEIFKGTGRNVINGKKKGGIKAFIKMNLKEGVPNFVSYDNASQNENTFLNLLKLEPGSIAVFDKGFNKYQFFSKLTQAGIFYVTRLKDNAKYTVKEVRKVTESHLGIIKDEIIEFSFKDNGIIRTAQHRLITYLDPVKNETLTFISNMMENKASTITLIYKNRWVIEVLFKQMKQNFELTYFLSDSDEGIKSQIWMALILNLLFTVVHRLIKKAEDFTTMVQVAAKNLSTYINFIKFLTETTKFCQDWYKEELKIVQFELFKTARRG